jgi:hypothetical protein
MNISLYFVELSERPVGKAGIGDPGTELGHCLGRFEQAERVH